MARVGGVMLADQANDARLRAFVTLFFDEADFRPDDQAVEGPVENSVAMKIDFTAVQRFDESAIFAGEELCHPAMALRHMFLDLTPHLAGDVFDLPYRSVESLPDRDQSVLALGRVTVCFIDDDFFMPGHCDSKIDLEEITLPVSSLRSTDYDFATRYPTAELFQSFHLSGDLGSNLF